MDTILSLLSIVLGLGALVLAIIVLVRLFQREGVLKGILGIICLLYTFIWGWIKAKEENLTTIMIAWTAIIVVQVILNVLVATIAAGQ